MGESCFFCAANRASEQSAVVVNLHRQAKNRIGMGLVEIEHLVKRVQVPRCAFCEHTHAKDSYRTPVAILEGGGLGSLVGSAICIVAMLLLDMSPNKETIGYLLSSVVLGGLVGFLIYFLFTHASARAGVRSFSYRLKYPLIKDLLHDGWQEKQD